jgi:hypothetical protein
MSGGFRVSDSTIETAAAAACVEADWGWTGGGPIMSPMECMTPIVAAALAAVLPSLVAEIRAQTFEADDDEPRIIQPCGIVFPHRPHQWPKFKPMPHLRDCRGVARGDAG